MSTEQLEPNAAREDYLWGQRWELVHRVWLSSLYHSKRERFFDVCDKCIKAFAAIGGAAAVSQLLSNADAKLWVAAAVSVLSTLSLVFGFSQKARRHSELAKDFKKLWAQIEEAGPFLTQEQVGKFKAQVLSLESSEPASLYALVKRCENQISLASGHPEDVQPLGPLEWLFMHFWDFEAKTSPAKS
jgi:hypothetical protein